MKEQSQCDKDVSAVLTLNLQQNGWLMGTKLFSTNNWGHFAINCPTSVIVQIKLNCDNGARNNTRQSVD